VKCSDTSNAIDKCTSCDSKAMFREMKSQGASGGGGGGSTKGGTGKSQPTTTPGKCECRSGYLED
jgi:hypothetical protein